MGEYIRDNGKYRGKLRAISRKNSDFSEYKEDDSTSELDSYLEAKLRESTDAINTKKLQTVGQANFLDKDAKRKAQTLSDKVFASKPSRALSKKIVEAPTWI